MKTDYIRSVMDIADNCNEMIDASKRLIVYDVFKNDFKAFIDSSTFQDCLSPLIASHKCYYVLNLQLFDDKEKEFERVMPLILQPPHCSSYSYLNSTLQYVISLYNVAHESIRVFYSAFSDEERIRINEAIHNYLENCSYSR